MITKLFKNEQIKIIIQGEESILDIPSSLYFPFYITINKEGKIHAMEYQPSKRIDGVFIVNSNTELLAKYESESNGIIPTCLKVISPESVLIFDENTICICDQ